MNYPIFYIICTAIVFCAFLFIWLIKSNQKLKELYTDYRQALQSKNDILAKKAGKKYYSAIMFGMSDNRDDEMIEKDLREA